MLHDRRILLIISGGIAAYKSLDLIRRLRERGAAVRAIMTAAAQHFVTPLSVASLCEDKVYTDLWSLTDESEMGHIRLSREADLVVVAPATADLIARMAAGLADDLATTALLASDKPVLVAPTMNLMMWAHPATRANLATLDGARGGAGRARLGRAGLRRGRLGPHGRAVGDRRRDRGNAGRRGAARRAARAGDERPDPRADRPGALPLEPLLGQAGPCDRRGAGGTRRRDGAGLAGRPRSRRRPGSGWCRSRPRREMLAACEAALPVDVAVMAAAVADWRVEAWPRTSSKRTAAARRLLRLAENPDILARIAQRANDRPALVVGFAAETDDIVANARAKRARKRCDWILANDVSPGTGTFGGERNTIHLVDHNGVEDWPAMTKREVAARLADRIADGAAVACRDDGQAPDGVAADRYRGRLSATPGAATLTLKIR